MAPTVKEPATPARKATGIDEDYLAWAEEQVALLRARRFDLIDVDHVVEEFMDRGGAEIGRLESALRVLLMHMLKWDQQPERRGRSWSSSIREQRRRVGRLMKKSPSLKSKLPSIIEASYADAKGWAAIETGLVEDDYPAEYSYIGTTSWRVPSRQTTRSASRDQ
jgi:hypothetical protein